MTRTIGQQIKWNFETNGSLEIYDKNGRKIYREYPDVSWVKREYDSQGNQIYFENSGGVIIDKRPKPCEGKEIVIGGEKFKLVKV